MLEDHVMIMLFLNKHNSIFYHRKEILLTLDGKIERNPKIPKLCNCTHKICTKYLLSSRYL